MITDQKRAATLNKLGNLSPGMEAAIANLLEPDETIIVGNNGIWGTRVGDLAARFQGIPHHCSRMRAASRKHPSSRMPHVHPCFAMKRRLEPQASPDFPANSLPSSVLVL